MQLIIIIYSSRYLYGLVKKLKHSITCDHVCVFYNKINTRISYLFLNYIQVYV